MKKIIFSVLLAIIVVAVVALAEFFPTVIVTGTAGKWVDTRAYTDLAAAITAIGGSERVVIIIGEEAVGTLTIPINVRLKFMSNGSLAVATQLTLQTYDIDAGDREIFSGAGDIDFPVGATVRSAWFDDLDEALDVTNDDTLTMVISRAESLTASAAVGDNVVLRWESPIIITHAAFDLTNLKKIEAGSYQIFGGGAGDIDFLAGSEVRSSWFSTLTACLTATDNEDVSLTILIDQPEDMDTDQIFDIYQNVRIIAGNTITITGGDTLTFDGSLTCPVFYAFPGAGTIAIGPRVNVVYSEWFGAIGDDAVDDSAPIQEAIDAVAAREGGTVQFMDAEYICNVEIQEDVTLKGHPYSYSYGRHAAEYANRTRFTANATGVIVDTPVATTREPIIVGIVFEGLGAAVPLIGVRLRDVKRAVIQDCGFDNLADQAILFDKGNACRFLDIQAVNCMLDRTRTTHEGVIEIHGYDSFVERVEATASLTSKSDANLYIAAFAVIDPGSTTFFTNCVGEFSDIGYYINGAMNRLTSCRADRNMGHGFMMDGAWGKHNQFIGCLGLYNSEDATNTYDHFHTTSTSGGSSIFSGCLGRSNLGGLGFQTRYGFYDDTIGVLPATWNVYSGCTSMEDGTFWFYSDQGNDANFPDDVFRGVIGATDGDTTPTVARIEKLRTENSAATIITDFDDALQGQILYVMSGNNPTNTIIEHGAGIIETFGSVDLPTMPKIWYTFIYHNGLWTQVTAQTWFNSQRVFKGADAVGTNVFSGNANALGVNNGFFEVATGKFVPYWTDVTP